MSQHDFEILTQDANTGTTFRAEVNAALQALASLSSGPTAPTKTYPYQLWMDTSQSPAVLYMRAGDNTAWIRIGRLNAAGQLVLEPFLAEHSDDGKHRDITANTLTTSGNVSIGGDVSFSDTAKPRCKVALSANQTIAPNTWTKLSFNSEVFDKGNLWDPGNAHFSAPGGDLYLFSGQIHFASTSSGTRITMAIRKNGLDYEYATTHSATTLDISCGFMFQVPCVQGDVVEIYVHHTDSVGRDVSSNNKLTFVEVVRLK